MLSGLVWMDMFEVWVCSGYDGKRVERQNAGYKVTKEDWTG